nr:hypothetical protein CFP56_35276 [Quercus suber]
MPVKTKKMIVLQARHITIECTVGITLTTNIFKHMKDHYKEGPSMTKVALKAATMPAIEMKSVVSPNTNFDGNDTRKSISVKRDVRIDKKINIEEEENSKAFWSSSPKFVCAETWNEIGEKWIKVAALRIEIMGMEIYYELMFTL